MKSNKKQKTNSHGQVSQSVRVEFNHPTAISVAIAGTFNDWRPEASQIVAFGDGRWLKELVLPPGTYEYLLVADGLENSPFSETLITHLRSCWFSLCLRVSVVQAAAGIGRCISPHLWSKEKPPGCHRRPSGL